MSGKPYWTDGRVTLYLGDCREVLPALGVTADCVVADPPYVETSLPWDRWPSGWLAYIPAVTNSLWCFGTLRMYLERAHEFAGWKLSQDVIWEKQRSATFTGDRFARIHEQLSHWYRGGWDDLYHNAPREEHFGRRRAFVSAFDQTPAVHGALGLRGAWADDGTRVLRSVLRISNMRRGNRAGIHPTEKPAGILDPLITYACPPGGLVVDPFAGSGSTLDAARCSGRHAIGVEINEHYCDLAARRLAQGVLEAP